MDVDKFKSCMENESDLQQRMQWRYRLEWRENKRLNQLVKEWDDGFGYWLLSEGTVREKLAKELREKQKSEAMKGVTLLDRMQKVLDSTPTGTPMRNRDDWKPDAMKRIAEKHQEDYDKSDYQVRLL